MTFKELTTIWIHSEKLCTEWARGLVQGAFLAGKELTNQLFPDDPSSSEEKLKISDYFSISASVVDNELVPLTVGNMDITDDGEGKFLIALKFEHAANAFPKKTLTVAAAIRYQNKLIEYDLWDIEANKSNGRWTSDIGDFSASVIQVYKDNLSHDPMDGHQRARIGFLRD